MALIDRVAVKRMLMEKLQTVSGLDVLTNGESEPQGEESQAFCRIEGLVLKRRERTRSDSDVEADIADMECVISVTVNAAVNETSLWAIDALLAAIELVINEATLTDPTTHQIDLMQAESGDDPQTDSITPRTGYVSLTGTVIRNSGVTLETVP